MAMRLFWGLALLALLCTSASAGRQLRQTGADAPAATFEELQAALTNPDVPSRLAPSSLDEVPDLAAAPSEDAPAGVLSAGDPTEDTPDAEGPAEQFAVTQTPEGAESAEAPVSSSSLRIAPAAAPFGGPGSCSVDWQANIQQMTAGSSSAYSAPSCIVVSPGVTPEECTAQGTAADRSYLASPDPACYYPAPSSCSGLTSQFPSLTPCSPEITQNIRTAAQQGLFNDALMENQARAPPVNPFSSIFNTPPSSSGLNSNPFSSSAFNTPGTTNPFNSDFFNNFG